MKVSAGFRKSYPKLTDWIEKNMPKVKSKAKVWAAFKKYAELDAKKAACALQKGHMPEVHSGIMPGANGEFRGSTFPNRVYLARAICKRFEEKDSKKRKMHILVESTLLHEMVHWGDWKDGKDQPGEEGKAFEKAAYGKDIDRYW
jgi:hypothetical protein